MYSRRIPSSDSSSNVALVAAAGALAAISSVGLFLLCTSRDNRRAGSTRFHDSKELYIPSRYICNKAVLVGSIRRRVAGSVRSLLFSRTDNYIQ